jgi:hypothetical protein
LAGFLQLQSIAVPGFSAFHGKPESLGDHSYNAEVLNFSQPAHRKRLRFGKPESLGKYAV